MSQPWICPMKILKNWSHLNRHYSVLNDHLLSQDINTLLFSPLQQKSFKLAFYFFAAILSSAAKYDLMPQTFICHYHLPYHCLHGSNILAQALTFLFSYFFAHLTQHGIKLFGPTCRCRPRCPSTQVPFTCI